MNILFDIRVLIADKYTGIPWFTFYFLDELLENDKKNNYYLYLNSYRKIKNPILLKALDRWLKSKNVYLIKTSFPNKLLFFLFKFRFLILDKYLYKKYNYKIDYIFMPNINFISVSDNVKMLLWVHDLYFFFFPKTLSLREYLWHKFINVKKLYKRADNIITVSKSTAYDLYNLGIRKNKIFTIYLASDNKKYTDIDIEDTLERKQIVKENYFLFLSALSERKNLELLLSAFRLLLRYGQKNIYFYIVSDAEKVKKLIYSKYYDIKDFVRIFGYISINDKYFLYKNAIALIYPSLYEGFALPVLDALKLNCPVITTANSSLLEIYNEDVSFVDSFSDFELYKMMCYYLKNNNNNNNKAYNFSLKTRTWKDYFNDFYIFFNKLNK